MAPTNKTTIDDSDLRYFRYKGPGWTTQDINQPIPPDTLWNGTYHATDIGATGFIFAWLGTGISVKGVKIKTSGPYNVRIDEGKAKPYSVDEQETDLLLYEDLELTYGSHTIEITNMPRDTNTALVVDSVTVTGTPLAWDATVPVNDRASAPRSMLVQISTQPVEPSQSDSSGSVNPAPSAPHSSGTSLGVDRVFLLLALIVYAVFIHMRKV